MKRGKKKKKISIIRPLLHCRDINLNYPLFHPSRERRRCSRTRRLSSNKFNFEFRSTVSILHALVTSSRLRIIKLQINTHNPPVSTGREE